MRILAAERRCDGCGNRMGRWSPRKKVNGQYLCEGCRSGRPGRPLTHGALQNTAGRQVPARDLKAGDIVQLDPLDPSTAVVLAEVEQSNRETSGLVAFYKGELVQATLPKDQLVTVLSDGEVTAAMHVAVDDDDDFDWGYPRKIGVDYACPRCGTENRLPTDDDSADFPSSRRCQNPMCGRTYSPSEIKEPLCGQTKGKTQIKCHLRAGHTGEHEGYSQSNRNPGRQNWASMHTAAFPPPGGHPMGAPPEPAPPTDQDAVAHHCPFCGSGNVTGGSDDTITCGYCKKTYSIRMETTHPNMPLTVNGEPYGPAGNAGEFATAPGQTPGGASDAPGTAPGAPPGTKPGGGGLKDFRTDKPPTPGGKLKDFRTDGGVADDAKKPVNGKSPKPNPFAKGGARSNFPFSEQPSYTGAYGEMSRESYMKHLALEHADDPLDVLVSIQAENA